MKKIIVFATCFFPLFASSVSFSEPALLSAHSPQIQIKNFKKILTKPKRVINIQYSILTTNTEAAKRLNASTLDTFRKRTKFFLKHASYPVMNFTSVLKINDSVLLYKPKRLISMRDQQYLYVAGQAHPFTSYSSINYDLASGKPLRFRDILQQPRRDLKVIASYTMNQLQTKSIGHVNFVSEGAGPDFKNYQNWNFTNKGLLITFNAYQVAAYAFGPQTVIIPYPLLRACLKPKYYQLLSYTQRG